jgi:DNA-binding response OmpR family regulator
LPPPVERPDAIPPAWRGAFQAVAAHTPPRILVAEDDGDMRQIIVETMRKDGYSVVEAETGGRLLVLLAHQIAAVEGPDLVDLVISDVRMPICTGSQILEQMRTAHWRTPFILMTAFGDASVRAHTERLGGLFFDKPFDIDDLRAAVMFLLRRESPDRMKSSF